MENKSKKILLLLRAVSLITAFIILSSPSLAKFATIDFEHSLNRTFESFMLNASAASSDCSIESEGHEKRRKNEPSKDKEQLKIEKKKEDYEE